MVRLFKEYWRVPSSANIANLPSHGILDGFCPDLRIDLDVDSGLDELLLKKT